MAKSEAVLDVDNAVQASILLLAADGGEPVAGPTQMQMMVFLLLKKVGPVAGRGLGGTDAHARCDSGDVDAELRRLSDAGAIRCGSSGIEATEAGRKAAAALGEQLDERTAAILRNTKWFYNGMTDTEAIVYTGAAYPGAAGGPGRARNGRAEGSRRRPDRPDWEGEVYLCARGPPAAPRQGGRHAHGERGRRAGVQLGVARGRRRKMPPPVPPTAPLIAPNARKPRTWRPHRVESKWLYVQPD